jgi:hypothetical protein
MVDCQIAVSNKRERERDGTSGDLDIGLALGMSGRSKSGNGRSEDRSIRRLAASKSLERRGSFPT